MLKRARCLAVSAVLALAVCCLSAGWRGDGGQAAAGPVRGASAIKAPAAARKTPPPQAALGQMRLRMPARWSRPSLRALVAVLRANPNGRQLYTRSGSAEPPADAYAGSFGMTRPNEAGVYAPGSGVSIYGLNTTLRYDFTRQIQQERNIALVTALSKRQVASLAVECDAAGWYLLTLHLSNTSVRSCTVRNAVRRYDAVTRGYFQDLDDTRTLAPGASLVLPMLFEVGGPNRQSITWEVESKDGGWQSLVLHAVTVDKLG